MENTKVQYTNLLHDKFDHIVKLYTLLQNTPRTYGTGEKLTTAEIFLIENIGDNKESLSVTDLAKHMGITKGAISQRLKKLEIKGLTFKEEDQLNISRSIVRLTSKGKMAYYAHKHWHETMDGGYKDYYMNLPEEKILFLIEFLDKLEDLLKGAISEGM